MSGHSYDLVAEQYAAELGSELNNKPLDRSLLDFLAEVADQGLIADIGCGPGHVAAYLSRSGVAAVGIDISPKMCLIAQRDANLATAAGDMAALPLATSSVAAVVCLYAVIHLDTTERYSAYDEIFRVLSPGGQALIAFHHFDDDTATGGERIMTLWWGQVVEVTFRFLNPAEEIVALERAGLLLVARLDRSPYIGVEYPSHRCYLLVLRSVDPTPTR